MSGDFARLENNTRYATFVVGDANDGARNVGRFNACTPAGMFNVRTTSNAINDNSWEEDAIVLEKFPVLVTVLENDISPLHALTVMRGWNDIVWKYSIIHFQ